MTEVLEKPKRETVADVWKLGVIKRNIGCMYVDFEQLADNSKGPEYIADRFSSASVALEGIDRISCPNTHFEAASIVAEAQMFLIEQEKLDDPIVKKALKIIPVQHLKPDWG